MENNNTLYVYSSNIMPALIIAIEKQAAWEHEQYGPNYESALVAGWKETLKALQTGKNVVIC